MCASAESSDCTKKSITYVLVVHRRKYTRYGQHAVLVHYRLRRLRYLYTDIVLEKSSTPSNLSAAAVDPKLCVLHQASQVRMTPAAKVVAARHRSLHLCCVVMFVLCCYIN